MLLPLILPVVVDSRVEAVHLLTEQRHKQGLVAVAQSMHDL